MLSELQKHLQLNHVSGPQRLKPHAGGSAEGARQGVNPVIWGTRATSGAPGDIWEAAVPRTMESGQLPHGWRAPTQQHLQASSFSFLESPGEMGAARGTGARRQRAEEHEILFG